jgi:hypothetical protein
MSKKLFTEKEIKLLSTNSYVKSVSSKGITYSEEFKHLFITENHKGRLPREIFTDAGFDVSILGIRRIKAASTRWRKAYEKDGVLGLKDSRIDHSGRSRKKELSVEGKNKRLEAEINLLKAENELLKKIRMVERGLNK